MQCGDAVDGVGTHNGEMRHADHFRTLFVDDGADAFLVIVAGPARFDGDHVMHVDLVDDLKMAR